MNEQQSAVRCGTCSGPVERFHVWGCRLYVYPCQHRVARTDTAERILEMFDKARSA